MLETLKSIILDFQETKLYTGVPRHLKIKVLPNKATVCIGVRRSGKSTYMFQLIKHLLNKGVPRENIVYINFFDDRLHNLKYEGVGKIAEAYYSLYPEKKNSEKVYFFFDEIQSVQGWEAFTDRLMRTEKCEIYITGSSARMLSREIATQMRGRALSWELFPFSFKEFLDYKQVDWQGALSTKRRLQIQKTFGEYKEKGGFPEVVNQERKTGIKVHQEYFQTVLFRDIIERYDVSHPRAVTDLAYRLMDNVGSLYSVNRLTGYLKSLGHKISKTVVSDYVEWFEDAYFLFTVRIYDASLTRSKTNPKKIYCIDHAMVNSVSSGILANTGHLLENMVFIALRRITPNIWYCKTEDGAEVDFMVQFPDRSKELIQVCETLQDEKTRKREITSLNNLMKKYGLKTGTVVTESEEETLEVSAGTINIVPLWRFMLNLPGF